MLPAALFAALVAVVEFKVFAAAVAAFALVTFVEPVCERALPAALFAVLDAVVEFKVFAAAVAAAFPVRSLFPAMAISFDQQAPESQVRQLQVDHGQSRHARITASSVRPRFCGGRVGRTTPTVVRPGQDPQEIGIVAAPFVPTQQCRWVG